MARTPTLLGGQSGSWTYKKIKQLRKMDRKRQLAFAATQTSDTTRGWWWQRGWHSAKQQQPAASRLSFPFLFSLSLLFYPQRRYGFNKHLPEVSCLLKRCQLLLLARRPLAAVSRPRLPP